MARRGWFELVLWLGLAGAVFAIFLSPMRPCTCADADMYIRQGLTAGIWVAASALALFAVLLSVWLPA
jgi:hypothetical protein